jgi:molecular chaperone DnaJ
MPKDYYVILGVSRGASQNQIKRAYRKIAKQSHPDLSRTPSEREFVEIREAYETLANKDKRRQYDADLIQENIPVTISRYPEAVIERRSAFREIDRFESVLDDFFEGFVPGFFAKERFRSPTKDLYYEMVLTPREAREGGLFPIKVPVIKPCPRCSKSGIWDEFYCPACLGNGRIKSEHEFTLSVPANLTHGDRQRISLEDIGLREAFLNIVVTIAADQPFEEW